MGIWTYDEQSLTIATTTRHLRGFRMRFSARVIRGTETGDAGTRIRTNFSLRSCGLGNLYNGRLERIFRKSFTMVAEMGNYARICAELI